MVEAAVSDVPGLVPGRLEIDHGGNSYTADTLQALAADASRCRTLHDRRRRCGGGDPHVVPVRRGGQSVPAGRGRPPGRAGRAARRRRVDPSGGPPTRGVEHRSARPVLRRATARLPRHPVGARRDRGTIVVSGAPVTAIAERRRRTTLFGFIGIIVLMVGAAAVFVVGVLTLSNSQDGEAVGVETRPVTTLPITPNALLAVEDDDGALVSLTVMTLLPDGTGGSIVAVPVNADATAAFGDQRRPLDELYAVSELDGFTEAVQEMLSITIERSEAVTVADLTALVPGADGSDLAAVAAEAAERRPRRPIPTRPTRTRPTRTRPTRTRPTRTRPTRTRPTRARPTPTRPIRARPLPTPATRMPTSRSPPSSTWGQSRRAWGSSGQRSPRAHPWPIRCRRRSTSSISPCRR